MANLLRRLTAPPRNSERSINPLSFQEFANYFTYAGLSYPLLNQTMPGQKTEEIPNDFGGLCSYAYKRNGIVFAVTLARLLLFSEIRMTYQRLENGRPGEFWGDQSLRTLEWPEPGVPLSTLLARAEQDVTLAGNFYATNRSRGMIKRLRPDWVSIVMGSFESPDVAPYDINARVVGYAYQPGGPLMGHDPIMLMADEVCHYAPVPDPDAFYRGMSWLSPIVQEIQADQAATTHKKSLFENGAPQPLDAKVLTPTGWTTMGEIEVGDEVIGRDGRGHSVIAVYPQGEREIYRVGFADGTAAECTDDHIWPVQNAADRKAGTHRTMTLRQIMDGGLSFPSGPHRWSVPFVEPVEYEEQPDPLPLDPYLLGALLGDGSFRGNGRGSGGVTLANAADDADEMQAVVEALLPAGVSVSRRDRGGWSEFYFRGDAPPTTNPLTTAIRELGLWDVLGGKKFVPAAYLTASIPDRVALLQGLIDSDGHIEKRRGSSVRLTTTSATLAEQVVSLVGGLGGTASIAKRANRSTYTVDISRLPDWIIPCRLARKVAAYLPLQRGGHRRFITSVEHVGRKQAQCISVDAPENLYVTDDYIVTHNTPNVIVSLQETDPEAFQSWVEKFREDHEGAANAYRTLFMGAGADATVVGANFQELDFRKVQGGGEPLALDTPVPTPDGWTTMGDIAVGDYVFGRDGNPIEVLSTGEVHEGRECYRVTFSDRTSIVADASHLWTVIDRNAARSHAADDDGIRRRPETTLTTGQLRDGIREWRERGKEGNRYGIPAGAPVVLDGVDLLVDPYVLGVWLGDGQTAGAAICGAEPDLAFIAAEIEARGYSVTRWTSTPGKTPVIGLPGGLLAALRALGVLGDKHIPSEYLRSSLSQRLDLLRGLMDTDGTVGHLGHETCEYSSKHERLASQVAELARSLGYRATLARKEEPRSRTGETWRVTFRADPEVVPFLLDRKADRCRTPVWVKNRAVVSIEPADSVAVRCIAVDSDDHLFRAGDGWTLTHNTRIAAAGGVPPVIVGLSEGLEAATYANYGQARRRFADGTMRPLWGKFAGAMSRIVPPPSGSRLWYDARDVSFLQEDEKDEADINAVKAQAIRTLVDGGFTPESAVAAIDSGDVSRLKHTNLYSVQLQKPGSVDQPPGQSQSSSEPATPTPSDSTANGATAP
jgi:hypothetical protein